MRPSVICVLCGKEAKNYTIINPPDGYRLECNICGKYESDLFDDEELIRLSREDRAMLSAYTRELFENNYDVPKLHNLLNEGQIERIIERYENKTIYEKLTRLILYAKEESNYFGELFDISYSNDYPIACCNYIPEFKNIIDQAIASDLLLKPYGISDTEFKFKLKWEGWQFAEEAKKMGPLSNKCFVAMSCNEDLREIYEEGIKKAVKETGYEPIFIEREEHNEKICDLIIAEIRSSKFLIADVTGQRQNVYYEAGFAHGLNRDIIWTCKNDEIENVHFDTRQYNHIVWEDTEDLKKKLIHRIKATII